MTKEKTLKNLKSLSVLIARHTQGELQRDLLEAIQIALQCVRETKSEEVFKD